MVMLWVLIDMLLKEWHHTISAKSFSFWFKYKHPHSVTYECAKYKWRVILVLILIHSQAIISLIKLV